MANLISVIFSPLASPCRVKLLRSKGITFYSNERTLHGAVRGAAGGGSVPGTAQPCPQLESAVVLREPVQRAQSHVLEVHRIYSK